jgi:hypothetical protein
MPVMPVVTTAHAAVAPAVAGPAGEPFAAASEAWFWYMACHQARLDGARVVAGLGVGRPCEPGDVQRLVLRMYRAGELSTAQLRVLVRYGRMMLAPDPGRPEHVTDLLLWQRALARIDPALRAKGIVA